MTDHQAMSVMAQLRNLARSQQQDFNRFLLLYVQERFLARLASSPYHNHFILKGGLMLYAMYAQQARPTRDLDFLGRTLPADLGVIQEIIGAVSDIELEDAVTFLRDTIHVSTIKEGAQYEGVRVKLIGLIGKARQPLQLDIGFGDSVVPPAKLGPYSTLLDMPTFEVMMYSSESVLAEKLQAMTHLFEINSRYKDFYDVLMIIRREPLEAQVVRQAITQTFKQRNTELQDVLQLFTPQFIHNRERQQQWEVAQRRFGLERTLPFPEVMAELEAFLTPLIKQQAFGFWNASAGSWRA